MNCDYNDCDQPAVVNYQTVNVSWSIDSNGNYSENPTIESVDESAPQAHWCEDHDCGSAELDD